MPTPERTPYPAEWFHCKDGVPHYYTLDEVAEAEARAATIITDEPIGHSQPVTLMVVRPTRDEALAEMKAQDARRLGKAPNVRTCGHCGEVFTQTTSGPRQKWCSASCRSAANDANRRQSRLEHRTCEVCRVTFLAKPNKRGGYARTCSRSCRSRLQWRSRRKESA